MHFKYKYKLNHLLSLLPEGIYPESIIAQLEIVYKIYSHEFQQDRYIRMDDPEEIPLERLIKYSELFQVSVDELRNPKTSHEISKQQTY